MYYLISYDITSNKLRKKVADLLSEKGVRMQYSVFQFKMETHDMNNLKNLIKQFPLGKKDSIAVIPIPDKYQEKIEFFGSTYVLVESNILIA